MTSSRPVTLGLMLLAASGARAQGTIAGTLFDSLRANRSLGGATVTIAELGRYTQTDGRGRFRFDSVPGGHYTLSFFDSPLDSLGLAAPRVPVDVTAQGVVNVRLVTPAPLSLLRILCGPAADTGSGALVGTVRSVEVERGTADAVVASRWTELTLKTRQRHEFSASTRSNGAGGYVLCRLPRDIPVDVTVTGDSTTPASASIEIGAQYVVRRDFVLGRAVMAMGSIRGSVKTAAGKAAINAIVEISGTEWSTRSDSAGRFALLHVPTGTHSIEAKQIGSAPVAATVDVPSDGSVTLHLSLGRDVQALPTATIVGRPAVLDITGFDVRRRSGTGEFMTDVDIEKYGFKRTSEAFFRFAHLKTHYSGTKLAFWQQGPFGDCLPRYYINGLLSFYPDLMHDLDVLYSTDKLRGIEVHTASQVPVQYPPDPRSGCGVVLIWTK